MRGASRLHPTILQRSRELRHSQTPAEQTLWRYLRGRGLDGFKFRRQHAIGPFIVDFYCAQASLVVEIDGPVHERQQTYDADRTACLESLGYHVLRFPNQTVLEHLETVLRETLAACHRWQPQR